MGYNSPNYKLVLLRNLYWKERLILRLEPNGNNLPFLPLKMNPLKGKFPIYETYRNLPLLWFKGLVYNEQIAVKNPGPLHGGSSCPAKKCTGRIPHQLPVKVNTALHIILGRTWKTRFNFRQLHICCRLQSIGTHSPPP